MMAVEGIGNLTQNFADPLAGQPAIPQAAANAPGAGSPGAAAALEDTFTPSSQASSAQDAGIFKVVQGTAGAAGTSLLFAQANASANQNGIPAQAALATAPAIPGQLFTPAPAGQAPPVKAVSTTNLQEEILVLNAQLPALGLSKVEIQQIDNLATQLQNFNPGAYAILINQFEALAKQNPQQNPQSAAANSGSQNAATAVKGTGNGTQN
jgi:hypothetical protein